MFERYTEKARRVIFFARYEASQFGGPYIETEHLLLGLVREDPSTLERALGGAAAVDQIRQRVEAQTTAHKKVSTSVDMPVSHECMRVLAYAAEEAERLGHKHIGTEHLVLGLLREPGCVAAKVLEALGARLDAVREQISAHGGGADEEANTLRIALPGASSSELVDEALLRFVVSKLSAEARRMVACAVAEAERLGHAEIGAGHLLLGILREESSAAAKLLEANGLGQKRVEAELFREISDSPGAPGES
ncbi:MAG: Clp protease N-terminal domain-containing protein [Bryobacteraceae bacterium]|jgi:ATP-dependent Clp protease ATP-binding subunit ClpA